MHRAICVQHSLFTTVHKHYSVEAWKQFALENKDALKVLYIIFVTNNIEH